MPSMTLANAFYPASKCLAVTISYYFESGHHFKCPSFLLSGRPLWNFEHTTSGHKHFIKVITLFIPQYLAGQRLSIWPNVHFMHSMTLANAFYPESKRLMSLATSILPNFNDLPPCHGCHSTLIFPHIKSKWPATMQPLANNSCCRHFTPLRGWPIRFLHRRQPATAILAQYWPFGLMICCMTPWAISNLFMAKLQGLLQSNNCKK
jgi:hypothetical protein